MPRKIAKRRSFSTMKMPQCWRTSRSPHLTVVTPDKFAYVTLISWPRVHTDTYTHRLTDGWTDRWTDVTENNRMIYIDRDTCDVLWVCVLGVWMNEWMIFFVFFHSMIHIDWDTCDVLWVCVLGVYWRICITVCAAFVDEGSLSICQEYNIKGIHTYSVENNTYYCTI